MRCTLWLGLFHIGCVRPLCWCPHSLLCALRIIRQFPCRLFAHYNCRWLREWMFGLSCSLLSLCIHFLTSTRLYLMYIVIHKSTRSVPDALVQKSFLVLNKSCGLRGRWFTPAKNRRWLAWNWLGSFVFSPFRILFVLLSVTEDFPSPQAFSRLSVHKHASLAPDDNHVARCQKGRFGCGRAACSPSVSHISGTCSS